MNLEVEQRFDLRLAEVLHESANPDPALHLEARIARLLREERAAAPPVFARSSLLLTGAGVPSSSSRRGVWTATLLHAAALFLIFVLVAQGGRLAQPPAGPVASATLTLPPPANTPLLLPSAAASAGGGGGQRGPLPATKGKPPAFAREQLLAPRLTVRTADPALTLPPTVDALRMHDPLAPSALGLSNGAATPTLSLGNGRGTGLGSGVGDGIGPGAGGNMGGGLRRIGGGVSAPEVVFEPQAVFSEEARRNKISGNVMVYLQVDEQGRPQHVRVLRGIGAGLDENAVEAVRHYRFRPALEDGHPVRVEMQVEVDFNLY